ncbi:HEAT repeat domain-containing protein [Myxococcus xanthus]|uniref:HEAT repeat domain-containing protein n=1 Tax=Myxococcus xanthus TaxID=34 RepID=UPI001376289D|nr:HEAT repeat domain-containing protein [Myxococcus xanthus]
MPSSPSLVWSSRENICAQLISLLKATPPEHFDTRRRIVWMLGSFGGVEQLPLFRALLFDPNEDFNVQDLALRAGARHGLQLSPREFIQLDEDHRERMGPGFTLVDLISFARLATFSPDLEAALLQLPPRPRGRLLIAQRRGHSAPQSPERTQAQRASKARLDRHPFHPFRFPFPEQGVVAQPYALAEWLFERWYHSDRHAIREEVDPYEQLNLCIALTWKERPEAWRLLTEWCQDMSAEELERDLIRVDWGVSRDELARITRTHPALHHRAAEALLLPLPDLIAHWGEERLLHRLERVVRAESVACKVPYNLVKHHPAFHWANDLLFQWDVARRRVLYPLLCDADVASQVRSHLLEHLSDHDRPAAVRWARAAERYPGNAPLIGTVVQHAALNTPTPEDRPLLLSALRNPDARIRGLAIEGLLALGESGPAWVDRLLSLAHEPHPEVRIPAAAGLVQQGQREWLTPLQQLTLDAPTPFLRAEALRWLGLLDGNASRALFLQVLASAPSPKGDSHGCPCCPCLPAVFSPEVEAAIEALSRLGTDEDLSALLDAGVRLGCTLQLEEQWTHHLARRGDRMNCNEPPGG